MPLFPWKSESSTEDVPWTSEIEDAGKAPIVVGLIIAAILVAVLGLWRLGSSILGESSFSVVSNGNSSNGDATQIDNEQSALGTICVHVAGAVCAPGVYSIPVQSRVCDAVSAAGGLAEGAAQDALNLARVVNDGEQIIVPTIDQTQAGNLETITSESGTTNMIVNGKVNINTADSATLQTLSGVGPSTAEKILSDREANGPYSTIEDLKRVSGIGDKKFASISDSICVG